MKRSALATSHSLVRKSILTIGLAFVVSAAASPASASSAATSSDSFRVKPEDVKANETPLGVSDPDFRALHSSWGKINGLSVPKSEVSVPSIDPVASMRLSSGFGNRRAPMRGASRNHQGIDIPGPVGTPIFATADGLVSRSEWVRGYGKFIELGHGNQIETRYGHLSSLNVVAGQRVKKGDVIGYMGSTGNSTGSHLHYEVRIAGVAANPMSFLSPDDSSKSQSNKLIAANEADSQSIGGPAE
jgi:murein DD-endopeptidase MepM/ murein hydrolase activator NlpD